MGWTVWGYAYRDNSEGEGTSVFSSFTMNKNTVVRAIRTSFVIYNDCFFQTIKARIYSNVTYTGSNQCGSLLYESDTRSKAEIHTEDYAIKETYFEFDDISLQKDTIYNLNMEINVYAPTLNSHVAWVHGYPDPVLPSSDYVLNPLTINKSPFQFYFIGADL